MAILRRAEGKRKGKRKGRGEKGGGGRMNRGRETMEVTYVRTVHT